MNFRTTILFFTVFATFMAMVVDATYRKPPFNGSIFGKRGSAVGKWIYNHLLMIWQYLFGEMRVKITDIISKKTFQMLWVNISIFCSRNCSIYFLVFVSSRKWKSLLFMSSIPIDSYHNSFKNIEIFSQVFSCHKILWILEFQKTWICVCPIVKNTIYLDFFYVWCFTLWSQKSAISFLVKSLYVFHMKFRFCFAYRLSVIEFWIRIIDKYVINVLYE